MPITHWNLFTNVSKFLHAYGQHMNGTEGERKIVAAEYNVRLEGLEGSLIVETQSDRGTECPHFHRSFRSQRYVEFQQ